MEAKSYLVRVGYISPTLLLIPYVPNNTISYVFFAIHRPTYLIVYSTLLIVCLIVTLTSLVVFLKKLLLYERDSTKWLPEQKWVVMYACFILLYINPIGVAILFSSDTSSQYLPYANIVISYFGFWGLACVWLFYSAPLLCRQQSPWLFYTPRVLYCLFTFAFGVVAVTLFYSAIILYYSDAEFYGATDQWPSVDEKTVLTMNVVYQCFKWFFFVIWIAQMIYTRYQLSKISYMKNRYVHLSFRYFTLQGTLLIVFYIVRFIIIDAERFQMGYESFVNALHVIPVGYIEINMDFVFQTVYCVILAYIYLPISDKPNHDELDLNMLNAYAITEKECTDIVEIRKHLFDSLNQFQKLMKHQIYICCIDRAIELCNASFEVYFDQPGQPTAGGSGHDVDDLKDMDLESMGYKFIALYNDEETDTFCCIGRHKITRKLLIMYRGTSSGKNWKTNSKYTQTLFELHKYAPEVPEAEIYSSLTDSRVRYDRIASINSMEENHKSEDEDEEKVNFKNLQSKEFESNNDNEHEHVEGKETDTTHRFQTTILNCITTCFGSMRLSLAGVSRVTSIIVGKLCGVKSLYKSFVHM